MSSLLPPSPCRDADATPGIDLGLPHDFNLAEFLLKRALDSGWADRVVFVCRDRVVTFGELAEMVNRAGNLLAGLGLQAEQRVGLYLADSPNFAALFLGAIKIGAVPVPFHGMLRPYEFRYLLRDSRIRVMVVDADLLGELGGALSESPWLEHVLVSGTCAEGRHPSLEDGLMDASPELQAAATTPDDAAFWIYSSGATGFPKAAVHLHHDPLYCCEAFARSILELNEQDVILSLPRMFMAYGLGNSLFFPLWSGARSLLLPRLPSPVELLEICRAHRPTLLFQPPPGYRDLLAAVEAGTPADLSSLRLCCSAGEPLPPGLLARFQERFGLEILDGLSSSEALHVFVSNRPGQVRPGSFGRPVPGYAIRLEDEAGREVAPGELGNLLVRGDSTSPCFWNQHRKTARTMLGSWLVTGDKCTRDEDGFLFYAGRSDDMIRVAGMLISPVELEQNLLTMSEVQEAAVVGSADEQGLTRLRAFVVIPPNLDPSRELAETLRARANADQPPCRQIRWLEFVPELPRTVTGRLQRYKLREGC